MDGFEPNGTNNQNGNNNINRQQENRTPEYSFWAEQMPGGYGQPGYVPNTGYQEATGINGGRKQGPEHKTLKFIGKAICFGLLAGICFVGVQAVYYKINPETSGKEYVLGTPDQDSEGRNKVQLQVGSTGQGNIKTTAKDVVSEVVSGTMPAIVSIRSVSTQTDMWYGTPYNTEASGSGIIVGKDENELLIATNNHVVSGTDQITVTFIDGTEVEAVTKGTDATADLAVVTVDISKMEESALNQIKVAKLGNSDEVKVGEMAVAIGNALGYGQSVTVGYISAKDREVEVSDGYTYKTMVLLQTDAAINPGNSGGALLNVDGEVIGINTVKFSNTMVEGMGYAIPISRAIPILNELESREILAEGEQGYLGVYPVDVTEDVSATFNMPIGVFLSSVEAGGPADKAGLKKGDIITFINEVEITSSTQLRELVSSIKAGTEIEVTFMRGSDGSYQEQKMKVELGARPVEAE